MFTAPPTYPWYRTLRLATPMLQGEDVYALQTALTKCGFDPRGNDGIFGPATREAVLRAQRFFKIVVDGLAGGQTQAHLALMLASAATAKYRLPAGLMHGQLEHESGFRLGNYSTPPRSDGSYDAGVAQRNTAITPPQQGFDAPASIEALAKNTREQHDKYTQILDPRRRWGLAAGAWNAPAYANYLAGVTPNAVPSADARLKLETYIASVTVYMTI